MKLRTVGFLGVLVITALGCTLGQIPASTQQTSSSTQVVQAVTTSLPSPVIVRTTSTQASGTGRNNNVPSPIPGVAAPTVSTCSGAPSPRLHVDGLALVTPGKPNTLRNNPGANGTPISQIPAGTELTVLAGPRCVDGLNWWQVNCGACANQMGWTAEGQGTIYWLEPEASPANSN